MYPVTVDQAQALVTDILDTACLHGQGGDTALGLYSMPLMHHSETQPYGPAHPHGLQRRSTRDAAAWIHAPESSRARL